MGNSFVLFGVSLVVSKGQVTLEQIQIISNFDHNLSDNFKDPVAHIQ